MKKPLALLLLIPVLASADPGAATRYLTSSPATLMDFGLWKLDSYLNGYREMNTDLVDLTAKTDILGYSFDSVYNAAEDRIEVRLWILPEEKHHAVSACHNLLTASTIMVVKGGITESFGHSVRSPTTEEVLMKKSIIESSYLFCEAQDVQLNTYAIVSANFDSFRTTTVSGGARNEN